MVVKTYMHIQTGIKDGIEEMEHEFPLETFCLEKQYYLIYYSIAAGNFEWNEPKSCASSFYSSTAFSFPSPTRF